jgi:hypothetical protein
MTTVLQTTYRPQIAPFLLGMIIDENDAETITRVCNTSAGIGFGVGVSQDTNDKMCVLGGSKFIGLVQRDKTLALAAVDPLSATDNPNPLDKYGQWTNVSIMTRGRIAVRAGANVTAWDSLFYDTTSGLLTNSASGAAASGFVTFTSQPVDGNTITIGGGTSTVVTFKASGATGNQVNIGPTLGDTLVALAAFLNGSADANIVLSKYAVDPPSPGGSGQGSGANTLLIATKVVGTAGNAYTIATNVPGATVSGATQSGGTAAATAITGGRWYTSALAGQLAVAALGIQY